MAKIKIEGQTLTMDDEIANDDELLKAALVTSWPDAKTASFKREGGKDGKELVVVVQKKAGTKGMDDSEVEEQERYDRRKAREEAEAERVRKLEDLALAADAFMRIHWEFEGMAASDYLPAVSDYVNALDEKIDALGDEIATIRSARRFA